jgi:predicted transcriptional regulator
MTIFHFKKSLDTLRKIYSDNLSVTLIAEELFSCSLEDDAKKVKDSMQEMDFDYYGVHSNGRIIGYIAKHELGDDGLISQYVHSFAMENLVAESTSLIEILQILRDKHPVFVLERNHVKKLITVADLQKQPIRMLVFGLISLLEMKLLDLIKEHYKNDEWKYYLSDGRIEKALQVYETRKDKNVGLGLIECLQLSDKGTIIKKTPMLLEKLEFSSKTELVRFFKSIEDLRNNTAHSQEYVYDDFNDFLDNITRIEKILSLT